MINEKQRAAKEAMYEAQNKDIKSVCSGQFYKKGSKTYEQCKNCANCFKYKSYKDKSDDTPEVKFHYVDTFRKCEFYKVRPIDENYIVTTSIYNIMYVNDLACKMVVELQNYKKDQDKETQKILRALFKREKQYQDTIMNILPNNLEFLAEYNSLMDSNIQKELNDFIESMTLAIKSTNVEDYRFIAISEVARTIIGYSVMNVDNRIKDCLKFKKDSVYLRQYKLNEMKRIVENLCDWTSRKCKGLNLNECKDVIESYRNLDKKLTNSEVINNALYKAKDFYKTI